jgi:hypothetical protein
MFGENSLKCTIHKHKKGERIYIWEESMHLLRNNISPDSRLPLEYKLESSILKSICIKICFTNSDIIK